MAAKKKATTKKSDKDKGNGKTPPIPSTNPDVEEVTKGLEGGATPDMARLDAAATAPSPDNIKPEVDPPQVEEPLAPIPEPDPDPVPEGEAVMVHDPTQVLSPEFAGPAPQSKKSAKADADADKQSINEQLPSTKRLGPLANKVPGAEKVQIWKRNPDGQLILIKTYSILDLAQSEDVASFINDYIRPTVGGGEYQVYGVDGYGRKYDVGVVRIREDKPPMPPKPREKSAMEMLYERIQTEDARREREMREWRERQTQQKDPIELLGGVLDLQEKVGGASRREGESTLSAAIQAMSQQTNTMVQAMMGMMQKSEENLTRIMTESNKSNPFMEVIMAKLLDDKDKKGEPMPPPPPPPNPLGDITNVVQLIQALKGDGDNEMTKLLLQERMAPRDIVSLIQEAKNTQVNDDFSKTVGNMQMMLELQNTLKQSQGEGPAAGFWEAVTALVSNRSLASGIGDMIRERVQGGGGGGGYRTVPGMPSRPELPSPEAMEAQAAEYERQAQAARERRLLLAKRKAASEASALERETINDTAPHRPVVPEPEPEEVPRAATPEEEAAVGRVVERTGKVPDLPPDIAEYVNTMVLAEDDGALIEALVLTFQYLGTLEDWQVFSDTFFTWAHEGKKPQVLEFIEGFFKGLEHLGYTDEAMRERVLKVLDEHFDIVSMKIQEEGEEDDEDEEGEDESLQ